MAQAVAAAVATLALIGLGHVEAQSNGTAAPGFKSNYLYNNVIGHGYDKWGCPLEPITVQVNVEVRMIYGISTRNTELHVGVVLRRWWTDPRLVYPVDESAPDGNILVAPNDIFTPDDVGISNVRGVKPLKMSNNYVKVKPSGLCYTSVLMEVYLPCQFNIKDFPYDRQSCPFRVESWFHPASIFKLEAKVAKPLVGTYAQSQEYKLYDDGVNVQTPDSLGAVWTTINYYMGLAR